MYEKHSQPQVRRLAAEIYTEKRGYLLSIARRHAHTETDAHEAMQESLLSFLSHFDPDRGAPPLAWLALTLKRQCWQQRKVAHLDRQVGQEAERGTGQPGSFVDELSSLGAGPEERVIERDDARSRMKRLKDAERRALGLQSAGYSYREIGELCGWTYTKTNRCLSEGRAALRGSGSE
jgi:DNA-directed RNA polymerase specialized sigma24 family protein